MRAKRWQPSLRASRKPFGIGEQRPNNYVEIWQALRENRRKLRYAWRILREGVCDGCSLGTTGLHDWTLEEVHLCNVRLRLLRLNTMPALDPSVLEDVSRFEGKKGVELRGLGRLPHPMVRRSGEQGFHRVSWDDALDLIAERIRASSPDRLGFYMTSRGQPNENYYAVQKVTVLSCQVEFPQPRLSSTCGVNVGGRGSAGAVVLASERLVAGTAFAAIPGDSAPSGSTETAVTLAAGRARRVAGESGP